MFHPQRLLKSGSGWRVGWDPSATEFTALVGGDHWAIELTTEEFQTFCRLLATLAETMAQMAGELMDEEKISCEVDSPLVWLEAEGYPHAFDLHFILHTGRRGEGHWPARVVPDLIQATQGHYRSIIADLD